MLLTIIQKEARDYLTSTKFIASFAICVALILLSFYVGATNYKIAVAQHRASQAENLRQIEGLTDWLSLRKHRIFLPPQPLEALVTGVSNDIGRTAEVRSRGEIAPENSRFNEDPIFAVFRFLDLNFVIMIILSLFAILLGYDTVSGEKERGALKLTFSNPVSRGTYILGKWLGSYLTLTIALVSALALGCLMLPLLGVTLSGEEWLRLGLIVVTAMLYFGAFLSITLFISTRTERTSSSFLIALVVWIGAALIVPRAATLIAARSIHVPSVDAIASQKATLSRQLWKEFREGMKGFNRPEDVAEDDVQGLMQEFNKYMDSLTTERDQKMDELSSRLNEDRANRQRAQQKLAFALARVSPGASLWLANANLAGTSLKLPNRFYDEASVYREGFNDFLKQKTGMNVGGAMMVFKTSDSDAEESEPIDAAELPQFNYTQASLSSAVANSIVDWGALALFNILFLAGAFLSFAHYDVR